MLYLSPFFLFWFLSFWRCSFVLEYECAWPSNAFVFVFAHAASPHLLYQPHVRAAAFVADAVYAIARLSVAPRSVVRLIAACLLPHFAPPLSLWLHVWIHPATDCLQRLTACVALCVLVCIQPIPPAPAWHWDSDPLPPQSDRRPAAASPAVSRRQLVAPPPLAFHALRLRTHHVALCESLA